MFCCFFEFDRFLGEVRRWPGSFLAPEHITEGPETCFIPARAWVHMLQLLVAAENRLPEGQKLAIVGAMRQSCTEPSQLASLAAHASGPILKRNRQIRSLLAA